MSGKLTEWEHWDEWFDVCSWSACSPETREALGNFAVNRYRSSLVKTFTGMKYKQEERRERRGFQPSRIPVNWTSGDLLENPDITELIRNPAVAWHDLEACCWYQEKPSAAGKTYKKYYLELAREKDCPQEKRNFLEGSVTSFLIRTRSRKHINGAIPWEELPQGMDQERGQDLAMRREGGSGIEETPGAKSFAQAESRKVFQGLDRSERVFVCCHHMGVSLNHPVILQSIGIGKTQAYQKLAAALEKIGRSFKSLEPDEEERFLLVREFAADLENWANSPESGLRGVLVDSVPTGRNVS